jgi:hypothetical protein
MNASLRSERGTHLGELALETAERLQRHDIAGL